MAIVLVAVVAVPAAGQHDEASDALPSGADVIDRFIEVTGGKDAYAKLKTRVDRGMYIFPPDADTGPADFVVYAKAPDKYYKEIDAGGRGTLLEGHLDGVVWNIHPATGPEILTGAPRELFMRQAIFDNVSQWRKVYKKAETRQIVEFNDRTCYEVALTTRSDDEELRYYAVDTGIHVGTQVYVQSSVGAFPLLIKFDDYRPVSGVSLPVHETQSLGGQEIETRYQSREFNVDIPDKRFELPAPIKALQESGDDG